jgi:hypothetical protein
MPTRLCVMPSSSGGSYKIGCGLNRMGGQSVKDVMLKKMKGSGVGAVLLDGGMGGQSSYQSLDAYKNATGMNPTMRQVKGKGLEKLSDKISGLSILPPKKKKQNIKFEM